MPSEDVLEEKLKNLESQYRDLKTQVTAAMSRITDIEKMDAVQSNQISAIKLTLEGSDAKLDALLKNFDELNGGKKALWGLLALIGTLVSIVVGYSKFSS